jgi:hypothetical protein
MVIMGVILFGYLRLFVRSVPICSAAELVFMNAKNRRKQLTLHATVYPI